jgi:hypothetical protein
MLGQASGAFTESSSALRILHVGIRNTVGVLTADSFTQTNPPVTAVGQSTQVDGSLLGVLSGSICLSRGDAGGGSNFVGGPSGGGLGPSSVVLGVFINSANGNSFENLPGSASGKGPYVSSQGTYGNSLFETNDINGGGALVYTTGDGLFASQNCYLTNVTAANNTHEATEMSGLQSTVLGAKGAANTVVGILKMPADATQNELVYDQRI